MAQCASAHNAACLFARLSMRAFARTALAIALVCTLAVSENGGSRPRLNMDEVDQSVRAEYEQAVQAAYDTAHGKKKRIKLLKRAIEMYDGHAALYSSLGVLHGELAASSQGGKNKNRWRKARNAFKLAIDKLPLSGSNQGQRHLLVANYVQAVYGFDPGPGMANVKAALRLCAGEDGGGGASEAEMPKPCQRIMDELKISNLDEIDHDEL